MFVWFGACLLICLAGCVNEDEYKRQIHEMERRIIKHDADLERRESELRSKEHIIAQREAELRGKDVTIAQKDSLIAQKEAELRTLTDQNAYTRGMITELAKHMERLLRHVRSGFVRLPEDQNNQPPPPPSPSVGSAND
jgi:chromosome segregation ATPase